MTKYKVVCEKNGGWCVIVSSKSGEDRFWGFRDEAHAREWIAKKTLEKRQLAAGSEVLIQHAQYQPGRACRRSYS
jgi:hypothetical protein